jgi:hypothetical protein
MKHDDFCISPDPTIEQCLMCELINRVRRDERDQIEGDGELDSEQIKEIAYEKGFIDGSSQSNGGGDISLVDINKYIVERIPTMTMQEAQASYNLYKYFGGS